MGGKDGSLFEDLALTRFLQSAYGMQPGIFLQKLLLAEDIADEIKCYTKKVYSEE